MGYVASYGQMQDATAYIVQVAKLAGALGVTSAYDQKLMDQFKTATTNKDSLSVLYKLLSTGHKRNYIQISALLPALLYSQVDG